jgi:hypothetical protein
MPYKVCYWDAATQSQQERDATLEETAEIDARKVPGPVPVPASVTRRQARQALVLAGKFDLVQPAIDAIPNALQRKLMQIEWDDSQEFERNRPSLIAIGQAIGLTSSELDDLFRTAVTL